MKNSEVLTINKETRGGVIKKGLNELPATGSGDLRKNAEKKLIKYSLQIAAIDTELSNDTEERKDLQIRIKQTTIGKRLKQIADNRKEKLSEKAELVAALKHLLKFFQEENIQIDTNKLKQLPK